MARAVVDPAELRGQRLPMSYEAWLEWAAEAPVKSEWVAGEVIAFMPTTIRHGRLGVFLSALLSQYVEFLGLGAVFAETIEMRLPHAARVPDILFVAREHLHRLSSQRLIGPADLVVEFVSADSVVRDHGEKFRDYAAAGVAEYWLIDSRSDHEGADFYQLVDGAYRAVQPDADGRYRSVAVPGFWFRPEWLWQEPLPNPWPLVAQIAPEAVRAALAALEASSNGE